MTARSIKTAKNAPKSKKGATVAIFWGKAQVLEPESSVFEIALVNLGGGGT